MRKRKGRGALYLRIASSAGTSERQTFSEEVSILSFNDDSNSSVCDTTNLVNGAPPAGHATQAAADAKGNQQAAGAEGQPATSETAASSTASIACT
ncbi:hypothetical protein EVAR_12151_1 [Eumeta japonica]|uniref:Uncharacterized protein n=1 Tax=Eumeta variegata TaxID=151549 RepID=A0A4C1UIF9_EUMVA|nr:hypothetical protein EVAR_12151_1 [Eumeta japonica]